ncbi:MAG: hypothetical protein WA459_18105 [Stellaceae bacterium]
MIDGLRSYPEMKPTGLPWLGDVSAHWDVRRAKRILKPTEIPVRPEDDIVTCFRDGQVTLRKNRRSSGFMIALLEQAYQGVRAHRRDVAQIAGITPCHKPRLIRFAKSTLLHRAAEML